MATKTKFNRTYVIYNPDRNAGPSTNILDTILVPTREAEDVVDPDLQESVQ